VAIRPLVLWRKRQIREDSMFGGSSGFRFFGRKQQRCARGSAGGEQRDWIFLTIVLALILREQSDHDSPCSSVIESNVPATVVFRNSCLPNKSKKTLARLSFISASKRSGRLKVLNEYERKLANAARKEL
jgi:hypothetical protein